MARLEVRAPKGVAQQVPEFFLQRAHRHVAAVGRLVHPVAGHAAAEQILTARLDPAMGEHLGEREDRVREARVGHRHVHMTPLAAALGIEQRDHDAHHRAHGAAEQVADLNVGQCGRRAGGTDLVEHASVAQVVDVVAGARRIRTGLAVAGDAAQHDARVARGQGLVAEAEARHHARTKAFDDHVGGFDQAQEQRAPFGVLEVQAQAALVAVDDLVEPARVAAHRAHGARVVAGAGVFDLDDVGAVIGEVLGGQGAGEEAGEIEDAHALEWRAARGGVVLHGFSGSTARAVGTPAPGRRPGSARAPTVTIDKPARRR